MSVRFKGEVFHAYSTKWYEYAIRLLIKNIETLPSIFPDREYISAEDIMIYITTGEYGAREVILNIKHIGSMLKIMEKKVIDGRWKHPYGVKLPRTNSNTIEEILNALHKPVILLGALDLLYDDLYETYFQWDDPDIEQNKPNFASKYNLDLPPEFYRRHKITDFKSITKMLKDLIPYAILVEKLHGVLFKLISSEVLTPLARVIEKN